jgi:thiol:disulfide interchange protein DsbA
MTIPILAQAQSSGQDANPPATAAQADQMSAPSVEIVYFIYYGNFDCQVIEPKLAQFIKNLPKNVHFEVLPVVVSRGQVGDDEYYTVNQYADLFFVLDYFGQEKLLRKQVFQTVMDTLANTGEFALVDMDYQMNFLDDYGIDMNDYQEAMESDIVDKKIEKALNYIAKFNIDSVPCVVIDGETLIMFNPDKGTDQFFQTVGATIDDLSDSDPKAKTAAKKEK